MFGTENKLSISTITAFEAQPDPGPHPETIRRRARRLTDLIWRYIDEHGDDRRVTVDSAIEHAARGYLVDAGRWVKTCPGCGEGFTSRRSDAVFCSGRCQMRAARRNGG